MNNDRQKIISLLKKFNPADEQEAKDRDFIEKMVAKHGNIFERACLEGHVTASALVVNPQTKQFLLHKHKKLNRWLQFGGHADGDTDLAQIALKEATEETGLTDLQFLPNDQDAELQPLDVEVQLIPEMEGLPTHYHLDFRFILSTVATQIPTPDAHESQELQFFAFAESSKMIERLYPGLKRLIKKAETLVNQ